MSSDRVTPAEVIKNIKDLVTPTGNLEADTLRALEYANKVGMDSANTEMMVVMCTQGAPAAAKAMIESTGGSYYEMRMRYG